MDDSHILINRYRKVKEELFIAMVKSKEEEVKNLEKVKEDLEKEYYEKYYTEEEKLATLLHRKLCHSNHTDMCSWYYEEENLAPDWNAYSHRKYLMKARKLLVNGFSYEDTERFLGCIRD